MNSPAPSIGTARPFTHTLATRFRSTVPGSVQVFDRLFYRSVSRSSAAGANHQEFAAP